MGPSAVSVELPLAPIDDLIRGQNPDLRVSSTAAEALAERIQQEGASVSAEAAERAEVEGRKTIMVKDYHIDLDPDPEDPALPVAPVDRIARLDVDDFRVSQDARIALTAYLQGWAEDVADAAGRLAEHADRKTVQAEDVEAYFAVCDGSATA